VSTVQTTLNAYKRQQYNQIFKASLGANKSQRVKFIILLN